jgi:hypothetical protein
VFCSIKPCEGGNKRKIAGVVRWEQSTCGRPIVLLCARMVTTPCLS